MDHIIIDTVNILHIDIIVIFVDYHDHLMLEDVSSVSTPRP